MRVETAMRFVSKMNLFSCQKTGGYKSAPSIPAVMGMSCLMCVTRGTCLGKSCLGNNGKLLLNIIHFIIFKTFQFFLKPPESQPKVAPVMKSLEEVFQVANLALCLRPKIKRS